MTSHHFISYSPVDGLEFALRLSNKLEAGPPRYPVWLDKHKLRPGGNWGEQIAEAIRACASLLFVMTHDSVESRSVCTEEWMRALRYKKPIVPILLHRDAEMPFLLGSRQHIDFTSSFDSALAKLRDHLEWLASPKGQLEALKDRLADARRDLRRADDPEQRRRVEDEISQLEKEIAHQQRVVEDPQGAAKRVEESISRGLERERQPERPLGGVTRSKFINTPPAVAPLYFQDRYIETKLIGDFLQDDSKRMMIVVGRAGIGKTAMVCRALKSLEGGQLPDNGGHLPIDGIVYLSANGLRRVTVPNLYADLMQLLPDKIAAELDTVYKDPRVTTEAQMRALLAAFPRGRVVVLLDNFEDVIDPETYEIRDAELDEALRALLKLPHHAVKVILTTRIAPRALTLVQPGLQVRLELDQGLESPYAENILREMDVDGKVGLQAASPELLDEARRRTRGYPRALEALFAILSADRYTTLSEVLNDTKNLLPEHVVEALVGEAFSRLDPSAQQVMQALAIYPRPVPSTAVDYLLQPYVPGINSEPILNRLVSMHFARREAGSYYLHPVDRAYALARIPKGDESDRLEEESPPYTQFALLHRGAEYFKQLRKPREDWKKLEDVAPQLAEFDLRYEGQNYDAAARVLLEIDYKYLLVWGHYQLMIELHSRLQGKISTLELKQDNVGNLGSAYYRVGQYQKAVACYQQALAFAREMKYRQGEGVWLNNLGNCYRDLGETNRALTYFTEALAISQEIESKRLEGEALSNLSTCYSHLGETANAIDCCKQALAIYQEMMNHVGEGIALVNLSENLIDEGRYSEAIQHAEQGVRIGEEIKNPSIGCSGYSNLALAYLYNGNLDAARRAAEAARQHNEPQFNHYALLLRGVIVLRQGDQATACEAFTAAVAQADALLAHSMQNYAALDSKGLALCGLTLCDKKDRLAAAREVFRAARAINKDTGVVKRVLRLLDALASADPAGVPTQVRTAAAGE